MALSRATGTPVSGAADTKGAYVTVHASTAFASSRIYVTLGSANSNARNLLVDIAVGAAGAESVIIANMASQIDPDFLCGQYMYFDVDIPAGSRIAARCQSSVGTTSMVVNITIEDRAIASLVTPVTFGTNLAASRGTQVDPGTTINTKGAYVQFIASTVARIDAMVVCATTAQSGLAIGSFTTWLIDVAIGAAGAEVVAIPDVFIVANNGHSVVRPSFQRFPISIPLGSRVAVRVACNRNTATERLPCITLIGIQEPTVTAGGGPVSAAFIG